jgi:hypothetical protein
VPGENYKVEIAYGCPGMRKEKFEMRDKPMGFEINTRNSPKVCGFDQHLPTMYEGRGNVGLPHTN